MWSFSRGSIAPKPQPKVQSLEKYISSSLSNIMLCSMGGWVLEYYFHSTVKILEQIKKGFAGASGDDVIYADYAAYTLDHYAMLASQY